MISFSEQIKTEILNQEMNKREKEVFIYSFMRTNGSFNKKGHFVFKTTQKKFSTLFLNLCKEVYNVLPEVSETVKLNIFTIKDESFIDSFSKHIGNMELQSSEEDIRDYASYIKGAFVGKGWTNNPDSKFYHLEIRVKSISHSLDIQEVLDTVGIKTTTIKKSDWYYTYVKKSSLISDLLKIMGATESLIKFENSRIERDFISNIVKMDAVEKHNNHLTRKSSEYQVPIIKKLINSPRASLLTINQRKLAELRIENKELSLQGLQIVFNSRFDKEISKSTVNNWLKQMVKMGEEL